jgi:crossover junction endodeoxyribonuclease RuvC
VLDARPAITVLGLDPGTLVVGWAVVEARGTSFLCRGHGTLTAEPSAPLPRRLVTLGRGLEEVLLLHRPAEAAIEEAFHGRNARAALRLGEGRGAALYVLAQHGVAVTGYANNVVKRAVTGAGRAGKERVRDMVVRLLALEVAPGALDASDALALALCHAQSRHAQSRHAQSRHLQGRQAPGTGPSRGGSRLAPRLEEAIRRARGGRGTGRGDGERR